MCSGGSLLPRSRSDAKLHKSSTGLRRTFRSRFHALCRSTVDSSKTLIRQYREGLSQLYHDVRVAWRYRRMNRNDRKRLLRRREAMVARNAFGELGKMIPILINPLPPPCGLVLIAFAYQFPRLLLSPQFHSTEQTATFARIDLAHQSEAASELAGCLDAEQTAALDLVVKRSSHQNADQIRRLLRRFDGNGPLSLKNLKRSALKRIAALARPRSPAHRCCCPTLVLLRLIRSAAADVEEDDALLLASIRADDRLALTEAEARDACILRGLVGDDDPSDRIARWLDATTTLRTVWKKDLPASFLFIFAALCLQELRQPAATLPLQKSHTGESLNAANSATNTTTPAPPSHRPSSSLHVVDIPL